MVLLLLFLVSSLLFMSDDLVLPLEALLMFELLLVVSLISCVHSTVLAFVVVVVVVGSLFGALRLRKLLLVLLALFIFPEYV